MIILRIVEVKETHHSRLLWWAGDLQRKPFVIHMSRQMVSGLFAFSLNSQGFSHQFSSSMPQKFKEIRWLPKYPTTASRRTRSHRKGWHLWYNVVRFCILNPSHAGIYRDQTADHSPRCGVAMKSSPNDPTIQVNWLRPLRHSQATEIIGGGAVAGNAEKHLPSLLSTGTALASLKGPSLRKAVKGTYCGFII